MKCTACILRYILQIPSIPLFGSMVYLHTSDRFIENKNLLTWHYTWHSFKCEHWEHDSLGVIATRQCQLNLYAEVGHIYIRQNADCSVISTPY